MNNKATLPRAHDALSWGQTELRNNVLKATDEYINQKPLDVAALGKANNDVNKIGNSRP